MSKADRTIRDIVKSTQKINEEENPSILPRIENKKPLSNITESFNFLSGKKSLSKDSLSLGVIPKDTLSGFSQQMSVDELNKRLKEQQEEIEKKDKALRLLQRNYDGAVGMLKNEKESGIENKKKLVSLTEENSKLTDENRLMKRRVEDMIERLEKYERELDNTSKDKKKINQSLEEHEALKNRMQELQNQLERKKKEVNDLDSKNRNLLGQLDKFKNVTSGVEEEKQKAILQLKELKNELIICQTENDRLHKIVVEYKVRLSDFEKLKEEYHNIVTRKVDGDKENKEFLREIASLRNEISVLKEQNKKMEDSIQSQNLQLKFGNNKEESLREELKELKNKLEIRESELSDKNSKVDELQRALNEEIQRYSKYKSLIEKYDATSREGGELTFMKKGEYDKLTNELSRLKEKLSDYDEMKIKYEKLSRDMERKNDMIDQYIADKKYEEEKNAKLIDRIKVLEEENKKYSSHNQKLMTALDFKNENEKVKDGKLSYEIEALRQKLDANISNLGDISMKHKNAMGEKESLSKQVESLKKEVETKNSEIQALNKQIEDLRAGNSKKDEEISRLKTNLEGGNKSNQNNLQNFEREIKDLKSSLEIKDNQLEALRKSHNSLASDLANKEKESHEATKKLRELQDKVKILTERNDDLNVKNKELNTALDETSEDLNTATTMIKHLEASIETLETNYRNVVKKLEELDGSKFKEKLANLEEREKQFNKVIAKIDHAQSSLIISLSCCECMSSLKNPVTLLPCCHNYCEKCLPKNGSCKECGASKAVEYSFKNKILEDVVAKVSYNQVILESLKPDQKK